MTSKPPIPYEKAIGAFNDSDVDAMLRHEPSQRPPLSQRSPWMFTDRYVRPNAWPLFSIWPFRLRRGGRQ